MILNNKKLRYELFKVHHKLLWAFPLTHSAQYL
nr:MAG TPA: hypothetical protein [Caudoviricetes sp.]